jgi:hypothetical protein
MPRKTPGPGDATTLDYEVRAPGAGAGATLALSHALFVITSLAFVPAHAFLGLNVATGYTAAAAFLAGVSLAARCLYRAPNRRAAASLALNALGLACVLAYLVYFWQVLEPLSMLRS